MNGNAITPEEEPGIEKIFREVGGLVRKKDRAYPPVFGGRVAEMKFFRDVVLEVAENRTPRQTIAVQGPPGAGKSALLHHFAHKSKGDNVADKTVHVVEMNGDDLAAVPIDLVMRLTANAERQRSWTGKTVRLAAEVATQGKMAKSAYKALNERFGLSERSGLTDCLDIYSRHVWPGRVCVVLAVDEAQTCPITQAARSGLTALHNQAADYGVLTVCFGLSNTRDVIEDAGLSRFAEKCVVELGALASGEGRAVLDKTLVHLGVDWNNVDWRDYVEGLGFDESSWTAWRDALVERLDEATTNFPQHLTAALMSVCEGLIEHRDAPAHEWDGVAAKIEQRLDDRKETYYNARLSKGLEFHKTALGALTLAGMNPGITWRAAEKAMGVADDEGDPIDANEAERLMLVAKNRGVISQIKSQRDGRRGRVMVAPSPVPSMIKHLAEHFGACLSAGDPAATRLAQHLNIKGVGLGDHSPAEKRLSPGMVLQETIGAWQEAEGADARAECALRLIADVCELPPHRSPELIADPKKTLDQMVAEYRGALSGGYGECARHIRAESAARKVLDEACRKRSVEHKGDWRGPRH